MSDNHIDEHLDGAGFETRAIHAGYAPDRSEEHTSELQSH